MDVKSADKRPEKYVGSDGKPRVRMVPVDKQVIKKESAVDEVSLSTIKKAVTSSGLKNVKKAQPTDKLKKDLEAMKLQLAKEGTISEATDMNKLKQLAAAGLVQKADVQKLLRVFAKMESGKTITPAEREMLLSVLSDLTSLITGDMSMLQKAKKAVKEEARTSSQLAIRDTSRRFDRAKKTAKKDDDNSKYRTSKSGNVFVGLKKEEAELDEGLGHISAIQNMMAKEREAQAKKKKYTAPTQAEIDADKKKERKASGTKKASMTFKDVRKRQYANMMGGLKNEEVELDEVLDRPGALDSYRKKADASGNKARNSATRKILTAPKNGERPDHSDELKTMRKRNKGQDMADRVAARQFRKSIGKPYINKEEVDLDEAKRKGAPKMQGDWLKKEREKNRAHDAAMGRTPTGRKKPERAMTSTQRSLAKMRAEDVEYVNEKLKVSDGMGAWVSDFQKSDAPQFKGKSDKERRDMAVAAYLSAKRGAKAEGYVSMAQQRAVWATRKDGGKGHPDNKGKK